jgi:hypothetical protein
MHDFVPCFINVMGNVRRMILSCSCISLLSKILIHYPIFVNVKQLATILFSYLNSPLSTVTTLNFCRGSGRELRVFGVISLHFRGGAEENHVKLIQNIHNIRRSGRYSNTSGITASIVASMPTRWVNLWQLMGTWGITIFPMVSFSSYLNLVVLSL